MILTKEQLSEIRENMEMHDKSCPGHYYHIKTILRSQKILIEALESAYAEIDHLQGIVTRTRQQADARRFTHSRKDRYARQSNKRTNS